MARHALFGLDANEVFQVVRTSGNDDSKILGYVIRERDQEGAQWSAYRLMPRGDLIYAGRCYTSDEAGKLIG